MVRVLVVDDSSFIRRSLTALLESDPDIKVIAVARDGEEAIAMVRQHDPDLVTLDVEMPKMNGLVALEHIMRENPCPVIMVSSLTKEGAEVTLKALDLGALDFYAKQTPVVLSDGDKKFDLCARVKALARRKAFMRLLHQQGRDRLGGAAAQPATAVRPSWGAGAPAPAQPSSFRGASAAPVPSAAPSRRPLPPRTPPATMLYDAVVIGVSTGGPPAVQKILTALSEKFPVPILIAQHMPASFTGPFAVRLNTQCAITVVEASGVERLKPGTAYICPGGRHLRMEGKPGMLAAAVVEEPKDALYKPSANVLIESAGLVLGRRALALILTGMGNDGLEGAKILKERGGKVIAQSENTCVVYGMPKAIVDANLADEIIDIDDMAAVLLAHFPIAAAGRGIIREH